MYVFVQYYTNYNMHFLTHVVNMENDHFVASPFEINL